MTQNAKSNVQDISQTVPTPPEAGGEVAKVQELNDATLEHVSGGVGTWIPKRAKEAKEARQ
jgi:hypothetical protein